MSTWLKKPVFYGVGLTCTIATSIWVASQDHVQATAIDSATAQPAVLLPTRNGSESGELDMPSRTFPEIDVAQQAPNLFGLPHASTSPPPPPPPPPAALVHAAPPGPSTPDLPFRFRGFVHDSDGRWLVQLVRDKRFIVAGEGDLIDADYRLDNKSTTELHFTYLPTAASQSLTVNAHPSDGTP